MKGEGHGKSLEEFAKLDGMKRFREAMRGLNGSKDCLRSFIGLDETQLRFKEDKKGFRNV